MRARARVRGRVPASKYLQISALMHDHLDISQVPLTMFLVMRGHKVHDMAKKKIGASLVTSMIGDYMKATTDAPSTRLATTLGIPPVLILSRLHVALCYRAFCRT